MVRSAHALRPTAFATIETMLKRAIYTAAALSAPGLALTMASERLIRPRLFYRGDWHPEPPDAVRFPYEEAAIYTADGLELQGGSSSRTARRRRSSSATAPATTPATCG